MRRIDHLWRMIFAYAHCAYLCAGKSAMERVKTALFTDSFLKTAIFATGSVANMIIDMTMHIRELFERTTHSIALPSTVPSTHSIKPHYPERTPTPTASPARFERSTSDFATFTSGQAYSIQPYRLYTIQRYTPPSRLRSAVQARGMTTQAFQKMPAR